MKDYSCSIESAASPSAVIPKLLKIESWWTKGVTGSHARPGDKFTVRFDETTVDFEITEATPDRRVVWEVKDCNLHWLADKKEWKGNDLVFEVSPLGSGSKVTLTQRGLSPDRECYAACQEGWDYYFGESLLSLLNTGEGKPDREACSASKQRAEKTTTV